MSPTRTDPDAASSGGDAMADPYPLVEHELALLLRRARSLGKAWSDRAHPELEPGAYPLLAHIARTPGVRNSDLAVQFGIGRATVCRQVQHLEELGLLARRPDPQDARSQLLELTGEGRDLVTKVQDAGRRRLRAALGDWSPDDVAVLADTLGRLNKTLNEVTRGL